MSTVFVCTDQSEHGSTHHDGYRIDLSIGEGRQQPCSWKIADRGVSESQQRPTLLSGSESRRHPTRLHAGSKACCCVKQHTYTLIVLSSHPSRALQRSLPHTGNSRLQLSRYKQFATHPKPQEVRDGKNVCHSQSATQVSVRGKRLIQKKKRSQLTFHVCVSPVIHS